MVCSFLSLFTAMIVVTMFWKSHISKVSQDTQPKKASGRLVQKLKDLISENVSMFCLDSTKETESPLNFLGGKKKKKIPRINLLQIPNMPPNLLIFLFLTKQLNKLNFFIKKKTHFCKILFQQPSSATL